MRCKVATFADQIGSPRPVQGRSLTSTEFRSTRTRAVLADKGQLGGLRSRAALLAHVLGKRIVHARLPATAAGAEELHNLRIQTYGHGLLVYLASRATAPTLLHHFIERAHPRKIFCCEFARLGIGFDGAANRAILRQC